MRGGSSWSYEGKDLPALPYGRGFQSVHALYANGLREIDSHPEAVIPVEHIDGPIMLVCGRSDALWPSCPMSESIVARLKAHGLENGVRLLAYKDAGHSAFGPPVPRNSVRYSTLGELGGSSKGNNDARKDSWSQTLRFLDAALKR